MKILLLGEYSNVHWTLAQGLRTLGHEVCVISNGDFWKDYPRDIDVSRVPGKIGGIRLMLRLWSLLPRMRGYDVVQLINPMFFELKAERLMWFYRFLRRNNRKVFLGAFGMDYYWVHECVERMPLRYSDFNMGNQLRTNDDALRERADWLGTAKETLNRHIASDCDGIITGLYEYDVCYRPLFPGKTHFIPFPVKPEHTAPLTTVHHPLHIFIGISRQRSAYKGTDIMLRAAEQLQRQYPTAMTLQKVEGVCWPCPKASSSWAGVNPRTMPFFRKRSCGLSSTSNPPTTVSTMFWNS